MYKNNRYYRALILNENFDTREFTIYVSNMRWVKNVLRPLLELCAKDDRYVMWFWSKTS